MNLQKWSKSILLFYNLIPTIVKGIDKLVLAKGVNSSQMCCDGVDTTLRQAESLINLTQRKVGLINLKVLTDETLLEMTNEHSKILILRYIDGIAIGDILNVLKLTRRTFFRRLNASLKEFEHIIYLKVLRDKTIYKLFYEETFLEGIFEKINNFNKSTSEDENYILKYASSICGFVLNRMKKAL